MYNYDTGNSYHYDMENVRKEDGGPGSGNWGHGGRPGKLGGSSGGGGKANRTGTKESGFSSEAKKKAEAKKSGGGGSTSSKSNGGETGVFTKSKTAKVSAFKNMSSEERQKALEDAPVGATIKGVVVKSGPYKGNEVIIEKHEEVRPNYAVPGFDIREKVWKSGGSTDNYIARTIRTICEGTNKYYEIGEE